MSSLQLTEFWVGMVLVIKGSFFVFYVKYCEHFLRKFLRSSVAGTVIFSLAGLWFLGHILTLGEADFGEYKYFIFALFLGIIITTLMKIRDFLSVRGAAVLALLISNELLKVAYMEPYVSRLVLVAFVYGMIILGMILGGWPYKGRDFVNLIFSKPINARLLGIFLISYGILILTTIFW